MALREVCVLLCWQTLHEICPWNLAKVCLGSAGETAYREVTNLEALCTTTTQDGWQGWRSHSR